MCINVYKADGDRPGGSPQGRLGPPPGLRGGELLLTTTIAVYYFLLLLLLLLQCTAIDVY